MMKHVIEHFYHAFNRLDADEMNACYHQDIQFEDPAFGRLSGDRARQMWRMLCASQRGKNFKVNLIHAESNDRGGQARWEAFYLFSKTGRPVHNIVDAAFQFEDGKIIRHTDRFNLYRWSRQALGTPGYLIGWTSFFRSSLQRQTARLLEQFERDNA